MQCRFCESPNVRTPLQNVPYYVCDDCGRKFLSSGLDIGITILISGDRDWTDEEAIRDGLEQLTPDRNHYQDIIIEGGARGADRLSKKVGEELGFYVKEMSADWDKYGRSAGPIRNRGMLSKMPRYVLAFHDDIEHSKGTKDCINEALRRGFLVFLYTHKDGLKMVEKQI